MTYRLLTYVQFHLMLCWNTPGAEQLRARLERAEAYLIARMVKGYDLSGAKS